MQTRYQSKHLDCAVCFERITFRGKLDRCNHLFCVACISRWAKTENTCPICKRRFNFIYRMATRPLYSSRVKRHVGEQRVQNRDQVQSNERRNAPYQFEQSSDYLQMAEGLNFLYYLFALDRQLDNL